MVDLFIFSEFSSTLYDQYARKMIFSKCGWYCGTILTSNFWGRHSRALEIREVELSPLEKVKRINDEDTGQKPSPARDREFRNLWNPPIRFIKQGGKRFPSQFHRSNFFQNFTKNDRYSWFSAQWSILSWFWPEYVMRFGWPSVTYFNLV